MSWAEKLLRRSWEEHGAKGPNRRGDYLLMCPLCEERKGTPDGGWNLSANPAAVHPTDPSAKGGWVCWRCDARGWGGIEFLAEPPKPVAPVGTNLGPPEGFYPFRGNETSIALEPFKAYLNGRGVYEYVVAIGGGAVLEGRHANRVVVPHVVDKVWQGWTARGIHRGMEPKYLHCPGMNRKELLWGLEWLPGDQEPAWIVEGCFDALPLFPYGVATFGKSVTTEQVNMIARLSLRRPVHVCLDGDAWQEAMTLALRVRFRRSSWVVDASGLPPVRWVHLPPKTDPGQLGWAVKQYVQGQ